MNSHSLYPNSIYPPLWHWSAHLNEVLCRNLRVVRPAPNLKLCMAPMDKNRNSKNPVIKLTTKKIGNILSPLTPAVGSDQIIDPQVVVHLYADVGQPM